MKYNKILMFTNACYIYTIECIVCVIIDVKINKRLSHLISIGDHQTSPQQ